MRRRVWIGAGAAAALAGVGWKVWSDERDAAETGGLWSMTFPRPEGGELAMQTLRGKRLLLNFWATWCPPCVKELPALDRFAHDYAARGWQVVGLAVDSPTPVRAFLKKSPVGFPVGLAGMEGSDLSTLLGNTGGALPFTAVFDRGGHVVRRKLGESSFEELQQWGNSA